MDANLLPADRLANAIYRLKSGERRVFLVQNMSLQVAKTLGGYLKLEPQFLVDYLHAIPAHWDDQRRRGRAGTTMMPWYRLGEVKADLPLLDSLKRQGSHIHLRFIGAREFVKRACHEPTEPAEHIDSDLKYTNIERTGGFLSPIPRGQKSFPNVAMVRHITSISFGKQNTNRVYSYQTYKWIVSGSSSVAHWI
jgi:hypothetical protein